MEEKRSGPARRIKDALGQRVRNHSLTDTLRKPIGRVILPKIVALLGVDQEFVETLEYIVLDIAETKPSGLPRDARYEIGTVRSR